MTKASDARPHPVRNRPPFECIALVLQGGGALGAYQAGVYQALDEAGLDPDWISGISIGAFNSAIIAGNPPGVRVEKLREFWESVTQPFVDWHPPAAWLAEAEASGSLAPQPSDFWTFASNLLPALNFDASRGLLNQWAAGRVLWNGTPGFFALRPVTALPDGTYLAELKPPRKSDGPSVTVRVIEYTVHTAAADGTEESSEVFCLVTDLLDPEEYPALDLACCYPRRWGCETVIGHHKTDMGEGQPVLRSGDPEGVMQEMWALFAVYQAICKIVGIAVNAAGIPPDKISFPHALAAATDTIAAFPP